MHSKILKAMVVATLAAAPLAAQAGIFSDTAAASRRATGSSALAVAGEPEVGKPAAASSRRRWAFRSRRWSWIATSARRSMSPTCS